MKNWLPIVAALLLGIIGTSLYYEHRAVKDVGATHAATVVAGQHAAAADTVREVRYADRTKQVEIVRESRDTLVLHLTDTVAVKAFVTRVDTLLAKDSLAFAADSVSRVADRAVIARTRDELQAALHQPSPRFATTLEANYDPIRGELGGAAQTAMRLIGSIGLTARIDQRIAIGERPQFKVGLAVRI